MRYKKYPKLVFNKYYKKEKKILKNKIKTLKRKKNNLKSISNGSIPIK